MSDEVESIRKEIGEKMARDGEPLHANASESARDGFRRGAIGWGSNTTPRLFGKGGSELSDWTCVCGRLNRRYLVRCGDCNLHRTEVPSEISND
jgi:hypothetical protein